MRLFTLATYVVYWNIVLDVSDIAVPFKCNNVTIGFVYNDFVSHLRNFKDTFDFHPDSSIHLKQSLDTNEKRTASLRKVFEQLRSKSDAPIALKGWRNELYSVYERFDLPLFQMERAATCVLGVRQFGVHINGYIRNTLSNNVEKVWIARRSLTKQTYPGFYDNMVAGGLTGGFNAITVAKKELEEEASITASISSGLKSAGAIRYCLILICRSIIKISFTFSYCFMDDRGIIPEILFVYDLELPMSFVPTNSDGEVEEFVLCSLDEVKF